MGCTAKYSARRHVVVPAGTKMDDSPVSQHLGNESVVLDWPDSVCAAVKADAGAVVSPCVVVVRRRRWAQRRRLLRREAGCEKQKKRRTRLAPSHRLMRSNDYCKHRAQYDSRSC